MTTRLRQRGRQKVRRHIQEETRVVYRQRKTAVTSHVWKPNPDHEDGTPNTQRLAFESEADIIGLSGTARWGKTDLFFGFSEQKHRHSVMFRRKFKSLRSTIERSRQVFNAQGDDASGDSYNEQLHRWIIDGRKKIIEFDAIQYEHNKEDQRGKPRDLMWFDEATEFTPTIIDFVSAWNFSPVKGQKCRVVLAFNVPATNDGEWVIDYFMPWIAHLFPQKYTHPNPAKPGELRWYATVGGETIECKNGDPFWSEEEGDTIHPTSRTFFFGTLDDNPYVSPRYKARLQALPEPLRSQLLYGNFATNTKSHPWQVIPTEWVKLAQKRWLEMEEPDMPLTAVGLDLARGGADNMVLAKRRGVWFDEPAKTKGVDVTDGPMAAGIVAEELRGERYIGAINLDVIGIGSSPYDSLKVMYEGIVHPINASHASNYVAMSLDGQHQLFRMRNVRAEYHWRFREALDPKRNTGIALPPGNDIVADLCAARYKVLAGGVIQVEEKKEIIKRIGRSPDTGESIMLAWHEADKRQTPAPPAVFGKVSKWR